MIRTVLFASAALALAACQPTSDAPADAPPPVTEAAAPTTAASGPPEGLEAALRAQLPTAGDVNYAFAPVDLDADGDDEVLAYVMGPMVCGSGGCDLYVFAWEGDYWRMVSDLSVTQTPVGVLETSTNGWRDLAVSVGGGGMDAGWVKVVYDGRGYAPNPTVAPAEPLDDATGVTTLIASEPETRVLP